MNDDEKRRHAELIWRKQTTPDPVDMVKAGEFGSFVSIIGVRFSSDRTTLPSFTLSWPQAKGLLTQLQKLVADREREVGEIRPEVD